MVAHRWRERETGRPLWKTVWWPLRRHRVPTWLLRAEATSMANCHSSPLVETTQAKRKQKGTSPYTTGVVFPVKERAGSQMENVLLPGRSRSRKTTD